MQYKEQNQCGQDAGPNDEERGQPHVSSRAPLARSSLSVSLAFGHTTRPANMIQLAKRIAKGAVIAAGGAFVWALVGFTGHNWQPGGWLFEVPALAAYAVLVTSWFVLPMGGILGAVMPAVVRGRSQTTAFLRGALLGVCSGVLAALITTVFMEWPSLSDRATIVDR